MTFRHCRIELWNLSSGNSFLIPRYVSKQEAVCKRTFSFCHRKLCLEKSPENPEGQSLKRLGWKEIKCPKPKHDPPNHVDLIGNFHVRGYRTLPARLWRRDFSSPPWKHLGLQSLQNRAQFFFIRVSLKCSETWIEEKKELGLRRDLRVRCVTS
jgi:hypothetical protein